MDYYQVLNITPLANQLEIKRSYHRLAKLYHPDVCHDQGAEARFQLINEAYRVLVNPRLRRIYDLRLEMLSRRKYGRSVARYRPYAYQHTPEPPPTESGGYWDSEKGWLYKTGKVDFILFLSLLIIGLLAIGLGVADILNRKQGEPLNVKGLLLGLFFSLILIYGWRLLRRK